MNVKEFKAKISKRFWALYLVGVIIVIVFFVAIAYGFIGYIPPVEQLENPIDKYASQIISSDGKTLGSYALSSDNRLYVTYKDLSPDLVKALIATEDARFTEHSGIDIFGLMRAFIKRGLLFQKSAGGGSTITQQLAKQLFSPNARNSVERFFQKPIEWVIAVQLERYYTKEEIVNLYLNKFDFLYNAVGIQSAAHVYFGKKPKDLTTCEAATLVGMCKNPSYYNPKLHPDRSKDRRNTVLEQMRKADYLTKEECEALKAKPLEIHFTRMDHKDGLAPYFREYLRLMLTAKKPNRSDYASWQKQKYTDDSLAWKNNPLYGWCEKNKKADGSHYDIYSDGLKIYTTIDSRMQQYAEEAVREHMSKSVQPAFFRSIRGRASAPFSTSLRSGEIDTIMTRSIHLTDRYRMMKDDGVSETEIRKAFNKRVPMRVFSYSGLVDTIMSPVDSLRYYKSILRSGFMAMDPRTGYVKAYVGGVDFYSFQYDMVTGGRRQVGSTIKPFLYSLAMIDGFTPCDQMMHVQQTLTDENGQLWTPRNSNTSHIGEMVSIAWGLQNSDNWVTAWLMGQLSPYTFVQLLHSYGLRGYINPVVSVCLGTPDVSVSEMVSAYTVFANKGIRAEPVYVTRIEDSYGNTIARFNSQMTEVIPEEAASKMLYMLRKVLDGGTASRIRYRYNIRAAMGGKTGTTQNNSDGWFMAFTPSLVSGCWVGGEDRSIHFDNMNEGQGASMALPIFGLFMQKVYNDPKLGYLQTENFTISEKYTDPCATAAEGEDSQESQQPPEKESGGIDKMFQ